MQQMTQVGQAWLDEENLATVCCVPVQIPAYYLRQHFK